MFIPCHCFPFCTWRSLSPLTFRDQQQQFSLFLSSHLILLLLIHHTLERLSVKNCLAMSWSAQTGNELALNLAPTLKQAEVIKRHMNYDVSEQRTDLVGDVNTQKEEDTICWNTFFLVWKAQKNWSDWRNGITWLLLGERTQLILSISLTALLCLIREFFKSALAAWFSKTDAGIDSSHQAICSVA